MSFVTKMRSVIPIFIVKSGDTLLVRDARGRPTVALTGILRAGNLTTDYTYLSRILFEGYGISKENTIVSFTVCQ